MDIVNKKCPICGSPLKKDFNKPKEYIWNYDCYRCGEFKILTTGMNVLNGHISGMELNDITKIYISGWIRENQGLDIILNMEKFKSLMTLPELSVFEKADKMLQYLAEQFSIAGLSLEYKFSEVFGILEKINQKRFPEECLKNNRELYNNTRDLLPLVAIGRIINGHEFSFLFSQYLENTKHYISKGHPKIITPAGWAYLETFRHPNPDSKKAFVAMWFNEEMKEICEKYIKTATEKAGGYLAETINEKDYNGDINDAIIGEIRNSKFVIADFTGNRGGVYYEAGFAYGLNIPVIYTCKEDWFNEFVIENIKTKDSKGNEKELEVNKYSQIHFDVNHLNFIVWKDGEDLYHKLLNRIKATIV